MADHNCYECEAPLTLRKYVRRVRVGRYTVEDASCVVLVCKNEHAELSLDQIADYERRASVTVLSEAGEIGGGEIRFARKAIGFTQTRLAEALDVSQETVSRWENDHEKMSRVSRLALLTVVRDPASLSRLDNSPARPAEVLKVHAA